MIWIVVLTIAGFALLAGVFVVASDIHDYLDLQRRLRDEGD